MRRFLKRQTVCGAFSILFCTMLYNIGTELGTWQEKMRRTTLIEAKAQRVAANSAANQLLRVSWKRFCDTQGEYVRWEAFVLWVAAIVESEGGPSTSLVRVLRRHCVEFIAQTAQAGQPELLALRLHEWIQERIFNHVKREGWLDALHFYGIRNPRCEGAWAYWQYCEREWQDKRGSKYPAFETWWRSAQNYNLFPKLSAGRAAHVIDGYVDWLAFAHWLRPFMGGNVKAPIEVARELQRRCPGFAPKQLAGRPKQESWQSFIKYVEDRFFLRPSQRGWLGYIRENAYNHPRHIRTMAYSNRALQKWSCDPRLPYPHFPHWRQAADDFIEGSS
jgi:hypothetical protein